MKLLELSFVWLLKRKCSFSKGTTHTKKSKLTIVILWESHQNKMKMLAFQQALCIFSSRLQTVIAVALVTDAWMWSRFAGGCVTSGFGSALRKDRKGFLLWFPSVVYFICSQPALKSKQKLDTRPLFSLLVFLLLLTEGFQPKRNGWHKKWFTISSIHWETMEHYCYHKEGERVHLNSP